ncbi:unnamed protein product [Amoebophrya sp. A25]|nr:unnamed protein product [Amoebophrya sp. A25]|eukprot:GSA25T00018387001.1
MIFYISWHLEVTLQSIMPTVVLRIDMNLRKVIDLIGRG